MSVKNGDLATIGDNLNEAYAMLCFIQDTVGSLMVDGEGAYDVTSDGVHCVLLEIGERLQNIRKILGEE